MTATAHIHGIILTRADGTSVLVSWPEAEAIAKARREWRETERVALEGE